MTPEQYLPYALATIAGLLLLLVVTRCKYRDERSRNERLRLALLELELQRINSRVRHRSSKPYYSRLGESE